MTTPITPDQIWQALNQVKDPEIPAVSLVEMGIVREVVVADDGVRVTMTPTFSGCPALHVMQRDIETAVRNLGIAQVTVITVLHPPWSSDWITNEAREKLRQFGLAPPPKHGGDLISVAFLDVAECPRCGSKNTVIKNSFGPTLCRMIYYCNDCQDAFEQFKPL
ncbi:1,2-phenylacetyl-CoA epoxidase, subunit D [hydrothermal vent metagenome]|uniref:1,2-phenylacetyl-CoA epoxidase, subunit D n=1 Tax=hydrothermal vent metagenome TaxID=652676 RepID=A0A3B0UXU3_9ZZZZ